MSNAALANAVFSAELEKWEKYSRWGAASKNKSKSLGSALSLCRREGIDAAEVTAQYSFRGRTPIKNKLENIQTQRWRLAKVAFDTVRLKYGA